jgi:hypothetical protein
MQVIYEESGGFAGLRRGCRLDSQSLAPKQRETLARLLTKAGVIGSSHAASAKAPALPDQMRYAVRIEDGGDRCSAAFSDATTDQAAWDLVAFLQEHARPLRIDESL